MQMLLDREWRSEENKKVLFESFLKVMKDLEEKEIYWREFYGSCYSSGGVRFCNRMGMKKVGSGMKDLRYWGDF